MICYRTSFNSNDNFLIFRYRSEYRNRRRSSSSSNSDDDKTDKKSNDKKSIKEQSPEFVERPLFESVEVVREDEIIRRPPSPQPIKRYYGRRVEKSDSELSDLEASEALTNG